MVLWCSGHRLPQEQRFESHTSAYVSVRNMQRNAFIFTIEVKQLVGARVTRFGEFSPIGWLLTLGSFCKQIKNSTIHWATCFHGIGCVLIFKRNWLGYILGDFFTNASGHPGWSVGSNPTDRAMVETPESTWAQFSGEFATDQEPILRLLNLQLQRQRCRRLERFSKLNKIFLFSKRARLPVAL
jgi:hypothetical protein